MANKKGKSIDNTHLSIDFAEHKGFIHRDYIAHCLRWSFVAKFLRQGKRFENAHILDVGCGKDQPLIRTLYSGMLVPQSYTGVDYNKLTLHPSLESITRTGRFELDLLGECDFGSLHIESGVMDNGYSYWNSEASPTNYERPNLVTSFEVLEHVEPAHAKRIMQNIHRVMADDGVVIISTPNWDGKRAAANHVNEMRHDALGRMFVDCGFEIKQVFGTFMNQSDFKNALQPDLVNLDKEMLELFEKLRQYHDSNVLANLFAPLFPSEARNALWVLTKSGAQVKGLDNSLTLLYNRPWSEIQEPWTSSENWKELAE